MKLISEEINNAEYLIEETNGKKDYKIKGIFLQSEIKNRNGRVYPKDVLMKEVKRYNQEFVNKKRAFAFRILFGEEGTINAILMGIGILSDPIDFVREDVALYAGLGYAYILLMIFPIYNVIESLDKNQIEAARDLGSSWWRIHRRVVIPFAKPGITSGCTMVFMLSAGALAAPQILGGPSSLWFTQIIYQWFNTGSNWPRGSAYAIVLMLTCVLLVLILMKLFKVKIGEIGR